eukprot:TRINITY_DN81500_c0_g1_i1.p1 TRINITY_DN81500_c0_g1~~TRINITY_DN81500_c0_g1_i1.p1  ORF type:complete len:715 (-),score=149.26 TRINITY_DN81500_c0_g1_i1:68-2212(-)
MPSLRTGSRDSAGSESGSDNARRSPSPGAGLRGSANAGAADTLPPDLGIVRRNPSRPEGRLGSRDELPRIPEELVRVSSKGTEHIAATDPYGDDDGDHLVLMKTATSEGHITPQGSKDGSRTNSRTGSRKGSRAASVAGSELALGDMKKQVSVGSKPSSGSDSGEPTAMVRFQEQRMAAVARAQAQIEDNAKDKDDDKQLVAAAPINRPVARFVNLYEDDEEEEESSSEEEGWGTVEVVGYVGGPMPAIALLFSTVCWVLLASGILFSTMWIYNYQEVRGYELLSAEAAAAHAQLHVMELFLGAPAAAAAIELGFRTGVLDSLADYQGITSLLTPHFQASPGLGEVAIYDPRGGDTVVVSQTRKQSLDKLEEDEVLVEVRSDRPDCTRIPGKRGCVATPLNTNQSLWFDRIRRMPRPAWWPEGQTMFWEGPSFSRDLRHESSCETLCWHASYAAVLLVGGGPMVNLSLPSDINETDIPRTPRIVVRAQVDMRAFQVVAEKAELLSRGEAFLCTADGRLLASADMADSMFINETTGVLRMRKTEELERPWAGIAEEAFVKEAEPEGSLSGFTRVSAWKLAAPSNATRDLDDTLRILFAVPQDAFVDMVLGAVILPGLVVGGMPFGFTVLAALVAAYYRYCKSHPEDENTSVTDGFLSPAGSRKGTRTSSRGSRSGSRPEDGRKESRTGSRTGSRGEFSPATNRVRNRTRTRTVSR